MRYTALLTFIFVFASGVGAQKPTDVLAMTNFRSFTAQDITPDIAETWIKMPKVLADARKALLDKQVENMLLEFEASDKKISVGALLNKEVTKKVTDPSEKAIKAVYDANQPNNGTATLADVRPQIIAYLRQEPEKQAFQNLIKDLKAKFPIMHKKNILTRNLKPVEVLVRVGQKQITKGDFTKKNGLLLYEYEANVFDQVLVSVRQVVDSSLYSLEAKSLQIATSDYIRKEITDKMKDYSNEETERLYTTLRNRLYEKYRVRFFLKEPPPFVQKISTDDDPSLGKIDAPVTVVMFTDLQCPACSDVYPVLKKVISEYGEKIRFVVRDFPLTGIHKHAFEAALAANAAHAQGRYFTYKELLYKNQDSLDTESLIKFAVQIGLNRKRFLSDMKKKKFEMEVRKDMRDAESYGVSATPTIFVNGIKVRTLSAESFRKVIEKFISR